MAFSFSIQLSKTPTHHRVAWMPGSSDTQIVATTRLRKTCPDCGKRGNWPKKIVNNACPECTTKRKHHAVVQKEFYDNCERVQSGKLMCGASSKSKCDSCAAYFKSDTYKFWLSLR